MKTLSIQRLALYGFGILLVGTIVSGVLLLKLLFNYETIKTHQEISKNAYDALFLFKYNTEHLLITDNVTKEATQWENSFAVLEKHFASINAIAPFNVEDLEGLMQSIRKAKFKVTEHLKNPLFSDKNVMEKSLLRRLGEGLNANVTSPYYVAVRDLVNAIDYLKQYEDFLLYELQLLDVTTQGVGNQKLEYTKNLVVIIPVVAFIFTFLTGIVLWFTIGKIEKKLEEQREKLDYIAYHDHLTQLSNRAQFVLALENAIVRAKANHLEVGLLFLDLDRFKEINDSFGHTIGDIVLCEIANRLRMIVGTKALISRLGGDEFTLIVEDMLPGYLDHLAQTIIEVIQRPIYIQKTEIFLTCSIGISLFPRDASDAESMLRNADTAMYKAKNEGKNTFQFYNQEMTEESVARLQMEGSLRKAIEKGELTLYYQPQIDSARGKIIGAEALLRWNDSTLGNVSPAQFIPLAEETGLILPLGNWVMKEALRQFAQWRKEGLMLETLAINIAAKQIYYSDLVMLMESLLKTYGVDPYCIELEITERIIVENPHYASQILDTLRSFGVRISIDDFGTGYSSLSYLKTLPIDKIKIDKSFVDGIATSHEDGEIIKAIIALAKGLEKEVIAEGVETQEQKAFLEEAHCFEMQGYLYAKPLPAEEFMAYVHTFKA